MRGAPAAEGSRASTLTAFRQALRMPGTVRGAILPVAMARDNKLTGAAGEHHVCSELARRDWAGHVQQREAWVIAWVKGLIVQITSYTDIDEARAAAERLAEERGSDVEGERGAGALARWSSPHRGAGCAGSPQADQRVGDGAMALGALVARDASETEEIVLTDRESTI